MGYRSNLVALIYPDTDTKHEDKEPYEALKTLMNTAFKDVADTFHSDMYWVDSNCCLKFDIQDVKWYESYPDVQAFNRMMDFFRDEEHGYCTEFIRIGEDTDDVEAYETGHNVNGWMHVRREIECDV